MTPEDVAPRLVGLREEVAVAEAERQGCRLRVAERDGQHFPMTLDYQASRITVVVTDGSVTGIVGIG